MTTRPARKRIPQGVKLDACLRLLGFRPGEAIEWHHTWALGKREINEAGTDYIPPQLDPEHIEPLRAADHKRATFGNPSTTLGSDIHEIAKTRRLTKQQEEFRQALLRKAEGEKRRLSSKIRSRGFDKRPRFKEAEQR